MTEKETDFIAFTPSGGGSFGHIRGTIQEVLDRLQAENVTAMRLIHWEDDGTNAIAVFSRRI